MALSQLLSRSSVFLHRPTFLVRHRSNKAYGVQFIEIELDSSSSSSAGEEVVTGKMKKLEEAIQGIIVRRAAPDWLPFLPGYSYWLPASRGVRGGGSIFQKLSGVSTTQVKNILSEDEILSSASPKGWPSSSFFIQGIPPHHPIAIAEKEINPDDEQG